MPIKKIEANIRNCKLIAAFTAISFIVGCSPYQKVPQGEHLVVDNTIYVNGKKIKNPEIKKIVKQQPNEKVLFFLPLKMEFYALSSPNSDSTFVGWQQKHKTTNAILKGVFSDKGIARIDSTYKSINNYFLKEGQAPVIYSDDLSKTSENLLKNHYFNKGYFNVEANYDTHFSTNNAKVKYFIDTQQAYLIDTLLVKIESDNLKALYERASHNSIIKTEQIYSTDNLQKEAARLSEYFKQNGVYNFSEDYIRFRLDTNDRKNSVKIELSILERTIETDNGLIKKPFEQYNVGKINVFTDFSFDNQNAPIKDSTTHLGINIYSRADKLNYKSRVLSDAIFFRKDRLFRISQYDDTYKALRSLRLFQAINVNVSEAKPLSDEEKLKIERQISETSDTTQIKALERSLRPKIDVNIYLSPVKKNAVNLNIEVSRSSLLGFGTTLNLAYTRYNAFKRGEIWSNTAWLTLGNYYSPTGSSPFFNAYEVGLTSSITFPRFLLPFNTEGLVPKRYSPKTGISAGFGLQKNIGLDRINVNAGLDYSWDESRIKQHKITLFKLSFLSNTNKYNYFRVFNNDTRNNALRQFSEFDNSWAYPEDIRDGRYILSMEQAAFNNQEFKNAYSSSYRVIADDIYQFNRYTTDYLIPAIGYTFTYNNQRYDKTRAFHFLQINVETAGNLTLGLAELFKYPSVTADTGEKIYKMFGIPFAQFAKLNINYSRYFNFGKNNTLAYRIYGAVTIPYGNSKNSVPFSETYFGGGVNYERGWLAYELGPGASQDKSFTYNIGNLKATLSLEYRFRIYGSLHGALFADAGNIWYTNPAMALSEEGVFRWNRFYKEISLSTGFGARYDFNFFIIRLDVGFKTFDPAQPIGQRWVLDNARFSNAAYQFALAYPF